MAPTFSGGSPVDGAVTVRSSACGSSCSPPVRGPLGIISGGLMERSGLDEQLVHCRAPLCTGLQLLPVPSPCASILKASIYVLATLNE